MPRKKTVQKRTPGFTTIDKEVHDLLDTVRPVAERLYRKLHQRINQKRGDRKVYPTWIQIKQDTRISKDETITKAIKELEAVGLIQVERSYNKELKRRNVNIYYLPPAKELSHPPFRKEPPTFSEKPTHQNGGVTRKKVTSMNITNTNKGKLTPKKEKSLNSPPPAPRRLSPDARTKRNGATPQNGGGSPKPMSAEELRAADEKWKARQEYLKRVS